MTDGLISQLPLEVAVQSDLPIDLRLSQLPLEVLISPIALVDPLPPTTGQGHVKTNQGNKHGRTDENGAVIVAVGATPGTPGVIGPLTVFPHLCGETTATGGLQVASVTAGALRTKPTPLGNLRVTTDDQGSLRVAAVTAGVIGPLTDLGNLQCRTDETGALLVTSVGAGSLVSAPSPLLNLRGRTDDQGALVVTGLSVPSSLLTGLSSYWKLDEASGTRVDSVGTNHLTPTNAPVGAPGKIGNACDLTKASSQYLSHPDPTPLGNEDFTYVLWYRHELLPDGTYRVFLSKNGINSYLIAYSDANVLTFWFNGTAQKVDKAAPIDVNVWHFVVAWHDAAADTLNLSLDNGSAASVGTGGAGPGTTGVVTFGSTAPVSPSNYFDGLIDEVGLWRRVLTPAERTTLYNSGAGTTYPFA